MIFFLSILFPPLHSGPVLLFFIFLFQSCSLLRSSLVFHIQILPLLQYNSNLFLFQVKGETGTVTASARVHHLPRSSIFLARSEALTCPKIPEALRRKRGGVAEGKWGAGCSGARCSVGRRVPRRGVEEGQCGAWGAEGRGYLQDHLKPGPDFDEILVAKTTFPWFSL